jgi:hypothetical protein
MYSSAVAAGATATATDATTKASTISTLTGSTGMTATLNGKTMTFRVPNLNSTDAGTAAAYLTDTMEYDPAGGH